MLDEMVRRKADFDLENSAPIALADGQEWHFPKPWVQLWPVFRRGVVDATYPVLVYTPQIDAMVVAIGRAETNAELLSGAATLGAWLLQRQYELADEDLDRLFNFRPADPSSWEWVKQVVEVATGRNGKKASSGGDA